MANQEQRDYWNSTAGQKWVTHQAALDRLMVAVKELLLEAVAAAPGESVLDVGCGAGDVALDLAGQVGPRGRVTGVDISEPLLSLAGERAARAGAAVEFLLGDAQTHGFPMGGFDLVCSRFGVMFFADPTAAFVNLRRALRPGGRLVFACWSALERNPWFALPLQAAAAHLGPLEKGDPRAPGPLAFSDRGYVADILAAAGYVDVKIEEHAPPLFGQGSAEEGARFLQAVGPLSRLLAERQPDAATLERLLSDVAAVLRPFERADGLRIPSAVHLVVARNQ